jgi:hypothetical protein
MEDYSDCFEEEINDFSQESLLYLSTTASASASPILDDKDIK